MTGVALAEHPFAMQLQSRYSAVTIATLRKDEAQVINDFLGSDRMMKSIKSTVSTLHTLSATACLGDAIGLVWPGVLMGCSTFLTSLCSHIHLRKQAVLASLSYLPHVQLSSSHVCFRSDIQVV
jgi:hypothetical protein